MSTRAPHRPFGVPSLRERAPQPPTPARATTAAIAVLVVDDHAAVRAGIRALLSAEPGIELAGTPNSAGSALAAASKSHPMAVLVSRDLNGGQGLLLCRHLKDLERPPKVVLYAHAPDGLVSGAAIVAGADALIGTDLEPPELAQAIRSACLGQRLMPTIAPSAMSELARRVQPDDRPILSMLIHGTRTADIADVLGITARWLTARRWAILEQLRRPAESSGGDRAAAAGRARHVP